MSLLSLALAGLRALLGLLGIWNRSRAERAGANAQAAAETLASGRTLAAIAEAEATAPRTDDAVDQRLEGHSI
jgi:hypothetical protein